MPAISGGDERLGVCCFRPIECRGRVDKVIVGCHDDKCLHGSLRGDLRERSLAMSNVVRHHSPQLPYAVIRVERDDWIFAAAEKGVCL